MLAIAHSFDNFLQDANVSIRGVVLDRGLWSDKQEEVGGSLGNIIMRRKVEIIDVTAESNPHNYVASYCQSQRILTDEMAAQELTRTGCYHLPLPLLCNAYYLSQNGSLGAHESNRADERNV